MSLQLGNPLECSVVGLVAPPSANSDLVFLVQDWSVGGRDCNVAPNISVFVECASLIGIMKSKHPRLALPIQRSQMALDRVVNYTA